MAIHFLDLPSEILVLILHHLDLPSLIACLATNRRVNSIIDGSALLQYRMAAQAACVEDNRGNTDMTSADRLLSLQKRQAAFSELIPSSVHTIQLDSPILSPLYALSGGIFFMAESTKKALRWVSLASVGSQALVWERLELDEYIHAFGLAVPEADLLVVLSSTAPPGVDLPSGAVLKLRFYEISTRSAHHEAQEPVIIVPTPVVVVGYPEFEVDICGFRVSLMEYFDNVTERPVRLRVYDWKKGELQMDLSDDPSLSTTVFLSSDIILLANKTGALELWNIQTMAPERVAGPEITLKFPQLPNHHEYDIAALESNPKGNHTPVSQQPFHSSLAHSLVLLNVIRYATNRPEIMYIIIPRHALLAQIPSAESRGEVRLWAEWGPSISRWLDGHIYSHRWPMIMCGQRCVFLTTDRNILLLDFNPYTRKRTQLEQSKIEDEGGFVLVPPSDLDFLDKLGLCGEQMHSGLGYMAKKPREAVTWDGVMMDEEWIVGIKDPTESDEKFSLEVWHLG